MNCWWRCTLIIIVICITSLQEADSNWNINLLKITRSTNFSFKFEESDLLELQPYITIDFRNEIKSEILSLVRQHTHKDSQHMSPYVLKLSQTPNEKNQPLNESQVNAANYEFTRSLILMGSTPDMEIEYESLSTRTAVVSARHKILKTVILNTESHLDQCNAVLCKPVWAAPLLINKENFAFKIHLHTHGVVLLPDQTVRETYLSGFGNSESLLPSLGKLANNLISAFPISENVSSISKHPSSSMFSIAPVFDVSHYIIGRRDNSLVQLMQASDSVVGADLCNCGTEPFPTQVFSLPDRMLIAYKTGVWEVAGNFSIPDDEEVNWFWQNRAGHSWRIFNKCIKQLAMSPSIVLQGQRILALGGCSNENEVFVAIYSARQASPVQFNAISGSAICESAETWSECHILSACVRPVALEDFFFLLGDDRDHSASYKLVYVNPTNGYNKSVNAEILKPRLSAGENVANSGNYHFGDFQILGISSSDSNTLFLWGDALLVSQDDGESWEIQANFSNNEITTMSVLYGSYFYLVTKNQEVWAGERHSENLVKIYPTYSFNLLTECSLTYDNAHFAALLSDVNRNLVIVYFDKTDSWKIKSCEGMSRLDEVIAHVTFVEGWEQQMEKSLHYGNQGSFLTIEAECPYEFVQMSVVMSGQGSVTQKTIFYYEPPAETSQRPTLSKDNLYLIAMTIENLERHRNIGGSDLGISKNSVEVWKRAVRGHLRYEQYLVWWNRDAHPFHFNSEGYQQVYESTKDSTEVHTSPKEIYLDFKQMAVMILHVEVQDTSFDLEKVQLIADTGKRTNLEIEINKSINDVTNAVDFEIRVREVQIVQQQFPPGGNLGLTTLDLKIVPTSFQCKSNSITDTNQQTDWSLSVITGCPPTSTLIFDYKMSQKYLATIKEAYFDCLQPTPDVPCFYFSTPFYPFFAYLDDADGFWKNFTGNYTLTVVGVTENSPNDIHTFTQEEIVSYNSMLGHPSENVWGPVEGDANFTEQGLPIYNSQNYFGMSFFCQPKSPCANILPGIVDAPEVYVLVEFSNKGVDHSTHCDFTSQFLMRVHGLPINTVHMSLILMLWGLGVQGIFILIYILCHCQVSLWTPTVWKRLQGRFTFLQIKSKVEPLIDWRAVIERRTKITTATSNESDLDSISDGGHYVTMRKKQPRDNSIIKVVYED